MAYDVAVNASYVGQITVTGGRVVVQEWPGIHGRTFDVVLPQLVASSWPDLGSVAVPRTFTLPLLLTADSAAAFYSLFDAVAAVVETAGTVTLTRARELLTGAETKTARAVYLGGLDPTMASHAAGRCTPKWQLLEEWH